MKRILHIFAFLVLCPLFSAQLASINENFDSFTVSTPSFPQNSWTIKVPTGFENFMMVINEDGANKFVQAYAFTQANVPHYLISPQIVAPNGTTTLSFEASKFVQSGFMGTVEAGLVSDPDDMSTFTSLGSAITLQTTTPETFTYAVPASSSQYIAFKFIGLNNHASTKLDNVVYGNSNLSVIDTKKDNKLRFAVNNNELIFTGKTTVKEIRIYNTAGRLISVNKIRNNSYDVSSLPLGIYIFETINNDGTILKSKFLKK